MGGEACHGSATRPLQSWRLWHPAPCAGGRRRYRASVHARWRVDGKAIATRAVVAMAQKIELDGDRVVFTFGPHHRALRAQLDQNRAYLEELVSRLAERRMAVISVEGNAAPPPQAGGKSAEPVSERKAELKQQALEDSGVQAMLDVFAAEIKDVEER